MTDTQALIARLEAATADQQRELLIEAFEAFHPYPGPRHYLFTEIDWSWDRLHDRFMRMLDAEAYESAALTLAPEGWGWAWDIDEIAVLTELDGDGVEIGTHHLFALAIVIAALRAKGEG